MHALPAARGRRVADRPAVRVLLTGAAGFIGSRVARRARRRGPRRRRRRRDVARRARRRRRAARGRAAGRRPGRRRGCVAARRGRRGVPSGGGGRAPGWTPPTRRPTAATTTTPPRCCWRRCSPRAASGWCWRRRWWSTARAGYSCAEHGVVDPLPRTRADLDAGVFEHRCPIGGEQLQWQLVDEDAPLRPRSLYAASKVAQENYALAWAEATGGSVVALRYHNVYGPNMPRDTPYSGVAAIFRSELEAAMCQGFSRTAGRCATSSTSTTSPPPTSRRSMRTSDGFTPANVCSGRPISILEVANELCEARGDAAAGGDGPVPQRRCPPHRRQSGGCRGVAGIPRRRRPARRSAGVRATRRCGANQRA